jgi:hypothetical protein
LAQGAEALWIALGFLSLECDCRARHRCRFGQKAFALAGVKGFGFANGFMMMGVALLSERRGIVVNSQTVTDQHAGEVCAQQFGHDATATALSD